MGVYSRWQLAFSRSVHQTHDCLVWNPTCEGREVTGCGNQLPLPVISLMSHFISSLRTALGVFPLSVCLFHVYYIYWAHIAVDDQKMIFCFSCVILKNRRNARIFFITQTDVGDFSATKTAFYTLGKTSAQSQQAGCPERQIHKVNFPGVVLLIQSQSLMQL